MKVKDFLSSELLPRNEQHPDIWSKENYWGLPDNLSIYTDGFNNTTSELQSKPVIQDLGHMDPEKYKKLLEYENCEIKRINAFGYDNGKIAVHILI